MKAILVLDEMPIRCGDCILERWSLEKSACECYPLRKAIDPLSQDFDKYPAGEGRPDWCPLKELPDKLTMADYDEHVPEDLKKLLEYYNDGFNDCLNQILGEED